MLKYHIHFTFFLCFNTFLWKFYTYFKCVCIAVDKASQCLFGQHHIMCCLRTHLQNSPNLKLYTFKLWLCYLILKHPVTQYKRMTWSDFVTGYTELRQSCLIRPKYTILIINFRLQFSLINWSSLHSEIMLMFLRTINIFCVRGINNVCTQLS